MAEPVNWLENFNNFMTSQENIIFNGAVIESRGCYNPVYGNVSQHNKELLYLLNIRVLVNRGVGKNPETCFSRRFDSNDSGIKYAVSPCKFIMRFCQSVQMY